MVKKIETIKFCGLSELCNAALFVDLSAMDTVILCIKSNSRLQAAVTYLNSKDSAYISYSFML